ncbi:MAG: NAD-dependent DNA ligase LigA [Lachnospiraceae bacterium]|nr:NAD-dependent DNA ligase LigA [Lachnospiraceae bacterium]
MAANDRMLELVELLNRASESYYAKDEEIMSNYEYDKLYDELVALEEETGVTLANSPTVNVGYESVDELPKEAHEQPMLSLGKTKSREELRSWLNGEEGILSWKLDGLTIVLTYENGELVKALTRGNGEIGEVITNNAKTFKNVPLKIKHKESLILRGEAVITYSEFERINAGIDDVEAKYKNPRNLCSGSVRQLNNKITAERNVRFYAFNLVKADGFDANNSKENEILFLKEQGFDTVDYVRVEESTILDAIEGFAGKITDYDIPSDGLVLTYDDIAYGKSLGRTAKSPRDSIAFKWADETAETTLKEIEWSASRTGLINPVAIFEPVSLEGTTVSRASVHNISIVRSLKLGIGDRITVYKANMIIPQIAENLTCSDNLEIPSACPVCGGNTEIRQMNDVQTLYCTNPECDAKKIKAFTLFVSRDAMNIDGLSEATLEKFIGKGYIHEFADLYHLAQYKEEICAMEGFGEKSYQNLINSIEASRNTTLPRVIYSLGIENIGVANAKLLNKYFKGDFDAIRNAGEEELSEIEGIGGVMAGAIVAHFAKPKNQAAIDNLLKELVIEKEVIDEGIQNLKDMTIVITGSLYKFDNRKELQDLIEKHGGKATGSVTAKTSILINNDIQSGSSKNKKAKELGIPIMTEEEFVAKYL